MGVGVNRHLPLLTKSQGLSTNAAVYLVLTLNCLVNYLSPALHASAAGCKPVEQIPNELITQLSI